MRFNRQTYILLFEYLFALSSQTLAHPLDQDRLSRVHLTPEGAPYINSTLTGGQNSSIYSTKQHTNSVHSALIPSGFRHNGEGSSSLRPLSTLTSFPDNITETGSPVSHGTGRSTTSSDWIVFAPKYLETQTAIAIPSDIVNSLLAVTDTAQFRPPIAFQKNTALPTPVTARFREVTESSDSRSSGVSDPASSLLRAIANLPADTNPTAQVAASITTMEVATTTNALSILLPALPSEVGDTILDPLPSASATSGLPSASMQSTIRQSQTTSTTSSTSNTSRTATSLTSPTPSTLSTNIINPTLGAATATPSSSTTSRASTTNTTSSPSNGTVAGITIGAAAGCILLFLALAFLYRRRHRRNHHHKKLTTGGPAFSLLRNSPSRKPGPAAGRAGGAFPEVAYLYDPAITPSATRQNSLQRDVRGGASPGPLSMHPMPAPPQPPAGAASASHAHARTGSASDNSPMVVSLEDSAWGQRRWQAPQPAPGGSSSRYSTFAPFGPERSVAGGRSGGGNAGASPLLTPIDHVGKGKGKGKARAGENSSGGSPLLAPLDVSGDGRLSPQGPGRSVWLRFADGLEEIGRAR